MRPLALAASLAGFALFLLPGCIGPSAIDPASPPPTWIARGEMIQTSVDSTLVLTIAPYPETDGYDNHRWMLPGAPANFTRGIVQIESLAINATLHNGTVSRFAELRPQIDRDDGRILATLPTNAVSNATLEFRILLTDDRVVTSEDALVVLDVRQRWLGDATVRYAENSTRVEFRIVEMRPNATAPFNGTGENVRPVNESIRRVDVFALIFKYRNESEFRLDVPVQAQEGGAIASGTVALPENNYWQAKELEARGAWLPNPMLRNLTFRMVLDDGTILTPGNTTVHVNESGYTTW